MQTGRSNLIYSATILITGLIALSDSNAQIYNIDTFLETCPHEDAYFNEFVNAFSVLKGGEEVNLADLPCQSPISTIPIEDYSDELIILVGIRTMFYMDRNQSGHLPWTDKSIFDWMQDSVDGFNILAGPGSGGSCCTVINGKSYINLYEADEFNRNADRTWENVAGNIVFYIHEARHVEGPRHANFANVSNCICDNLVGCDVDYDESNLGSYGADYFVRNLLLTGEINVGMANLSASRKNQIAGSNLITMNNMVSNRFCQNPPATPVMPANPGGELAIDEKLQEIFWAIESLQPETFSGGSELRSLDGYVYRYFQSSGVYVAVRDEQIYLAGGDFGDQVIHAGSVDEILLLIRSMQAT